MVVVVQLPSVSDSLRPHGLQHTRPPCPLPSPEVCPSSCPLLRWCHSAILSCDALFSTYSQSFPASGTFLTSQLFASDGQNTGVSASAWVLPMTIQSWFPLRFTGLISLLSKGLWDVFFSTTVQRHQFFALHLPYGPPLPAIHEHWEDQSTWRVSIRWYRMVAP